MEGAEQVPPSRPFAPGTAAAGCSTGEWWQLRRPLQMALRGLPQGPVAKRNGTSGLILVLRLR